MPYKYFTPQQLTSNDVNTYLMNQSVMVFDSVADRNTNLTAPTEGMMVYLKNDDTFSVYDGSSWKVYATASLTASSGLLVYQSSWTTATYTGSWGSYSDPTWGPAKYYRSNDGIVHLRGLVKRLNTSTATIFTLPVGYRPPHAHLFAVAADLGVGRVDVSTNGSVSYSGTQAGSPNPASWLSLFEIKFGVF